MGRKEDDIFRKLKKQKPLVKRGDTPPLPSGDARKPRSAPISRQTEEPRASAPDRGAGQAGRQAQRHTAAPRRELTVFGEEETASVRRPTSGRPVVRSAASPSAARKPEPKAEGRSRGEAADSIRVERPADRGTAPRSSGAHEPVRKGVRDHDRPEPRPAAARDKEAREPHASARPAARVRTSPGQLEEPFRMAEERTISVRERSYGQPMPVHKSVAARSERAPDAAEPVLSYRHELKYYINYRDYVLLKGVLKALLPLDSNAGPNGEYHIRSLYFDDAYETALAEKMAGYDVRNKFRIRIYDFSDDVIKFEKKMKRGQYIAKTSLLISRDECEALIAGDCDCLLGRKEPLAEEIYLQMKNSLLRPRVLVDYFREAYVSPFENVRITFDKDIRASLMLTDIFDSKAPAISVLEPGTMVLEVKFNRYLPPFIQSVLNNVNAAQRSAVSKYVLCRKYE